MGTWRNWYTHTFEGRGSQDREGSSPSVPTQIIRIGDGAGMLEVHGSQGRAGSSAAVNLHPYDYI